jgi:hypothetical protein
MSNPALVLKSCCLVLFMAGERFIYTFCCTVISVLA